MAEYQKLLDEMKEPAASLRHAVPGTWHGFLAMHHGCMADGAVAARVKEAIALAISVVKGCDGCIAHHAQRAARLGATEAEVAEILAIALLMDGGPATVQGPRAWEAFLEFRGPSKIADVA